MNWNGYIFTQENTFENVVWKMAAILSRPQCVNNLLEKSLEKSFLVCGLPRWGACGHSLQNEVFICHLINPPKADIFRLKHFQAQKPEKESEYRSFWFWCYAPINCQINQLINRCFMPRINFAKLPIWCCVCMWKFKLFGKNNLPCADNLTFCMTRIS